MPAAELENSAARIDREESLDYSSELKYLTKEFALDRQTLITVGGFPP
jgi:hypothetical protein